MKSTYRTAGLLVIGMLAFSACTESTAEPFVRACPAVSQLVIQPSSISLTSLGATASLNASAIDDAGNPVTGVTMSWTSLNTAIATVSVAGAVTARAAGTALLVASVASCNAADTAAVTVNQQIKRINVSPDVDTVSPGTSLQLQATAQDSLGNTVPNTSFNWSSANPSVAVVDGAGRVSGVTVGTAWVHAANAGWQDSSRIHVLNTSQTPPPSSGQLNEPPGMTRLIWTDGTSKTYSSTVGSFIYGGRWTDNQYVQVVPDPANPTGSGFAIEKRYVAGDGDGWSGLANLNGYGGGFGALSEEYFRFRAKFSTNWDHHTTGTQKLWYFGTTNRGTATDFFLSAHTVGTQFQIRFIPQITDASPGQGAQGADGAQRNFLASSDPSLYVNPGEWFTLEVWVKAQTAPGTADGEVKMWLNGRNLGHWSGMEWLSASATGAKLNGIQTFLFWGGNGDTKTVNDYIRLGELYVSGKQ